jgi:hypothetical protein
VIGLRLNDVRGLFVAAWVLALGGAWSPAQPAPLIAAHAHNDYLHQHPLLDALDQGFCSVEADIYLVDGKLLVAHERSMTKPERTLQALYLDPLRGRIKQNGGRVYRNGPEVTLLIDLKTDWRTTYPVLREVLKEYADIFSAFRDGKKETNAVLAILSGDRSLDMFAGETVRYAAYDGQLTDLDSKESADLIPWISANWGGSFKWRGVGEMPEDEKAKLAGIVRQAHERGRRLRFWGGPDKAALWGAMRDNGVDIINTDDLAGLRRFLGGP